MGFLKKNKHEKKNESVDEPMKESPTDLLNERVLGLREELVDFKNITIKKIEKIEHLINILDEDYFELKEKINSPKPEEKETKPDGIQQKHIVFLEQRISTLEKYLKEFMVFGKISIQNHKKITDIETNFEKFKAKEPKEIILDNPDEEEKDRFKKLEKEIDTLKNDKVFLVEDE